MKIFVTGAGGYIASLLIPELVEMENVEHITGIDIHPVDFHSKKFSFYTADVRDPEIMELIKGHDYLIHLAFIVTPRGSLGEIDSINIYGTKNVFYAAAKAGIKHIFYTSSIAAYGADPSHILPLNEDSSLRPTREWYYSKAKGEIEFFINRFRNNYKKIKLTIFRPAILVGPKINNPFGSLLKLPFLPDFGYETRIEWVNDRDVINAILHAIRLGKGGIYNIGGGNPLTICEIAKITGSRCIKLNHNLTLRVLKILAKIGLINWGYYQWLDKPLKYSLWMDSSKAKRELGWTPQFDSAGAIKNFLSIMD